MWSLKPKCTCGNGDDVEEHYLRCDLQYRPNSFPQKKKRLGIFYPMKIVKYKSHYN